MVWGMFSLLRRAEAPPQFSLGELVGQRGRVTVAIPAGRSGSVLLSYGGSTHDLSATSSEEIAQGTLVTVTDIAGTTLVVIPAAASSAMGGGSDA
jgi:membrane protein implicated in regulation of membrane protease activity